MLLYCVTETSNSVRPFVIFDKRFEHFSSVIMRKKKTRVVRTSIKDHEKTFPCQKMDPLSK